MSKFLTMLSHSAKTASIFLFPTLWGALCISGFAKEAVVKVDETSTRVQAQGKLCLFKLAIENELSQELPVHIRLDVIDSKNQVHGSVERDAVLKLGKVAVDMLAEVMTKGHEMDQNQLLWFRVRYRVSPQPGKSQFAQNEGLIAFSEISPNLFSLRISVPRGIDEGNRCRIHVFANNPVSARLLKGVEVHAELKVQSKGSEQKLHAAGITNASGYVELDFQLPRELEDYETELKVKGQLGTLTQEITKSIVFGDHSQILISTDKPLYQPGQMLHVRGLVFDASKHAISNEKLTLTIQDENLVDTLYRTNLQTSRFGIVSADWQIPKNVRLGYYRIDLFKDPEDLSRQRDVQIIKIGRYDLPNFTLNIKPDRTYYLPGQNAEVDIKVEYLFGQPVLHSRVRVVRETERRWNYRAQKWDIEEEQSYEGESDAQGRFLAKIDLDGEHDRLSEQEYERFHDLTFAVYATDPSTGKTEQRRFDLRITRDPIHIYVIEKGYFHSQGVPLDFYLSTLYADGTPAKCEVAISESFSLDPRNPTNTTILGGEQVLRVVKTNNYGVAKVKSLGLSRSGESSHDRSFLSFMARDKQGLKGHQKESLWFHDEISVRVSTNRTLYRTGEGIDAQVESSEPSQEVLLEVTRESKVLFSQLLRLRQGRAFIVIPYRPEFQDELQLLAYSVDVHPRRYYSQPSDCRHVLYPRNRELKLDMRLDQSSYKPGEEAGISFRVRDPNGIPAESALGIFVIDKAVEERARTEREFGSSYGFHRACARYLDYRELSGLTRRDLDRLDLTEPLPAGMELAAEVLLNQGNDCDSPEFRESEYEKDPRQIFEEWIKTELKPLKDALTRRFDQNGEHPIDLGSLDRLLGEAKLPFEEMHDPWGSAYRSKFSVRRELDVMEILSSGPDKRWGTADDFVAHSLNWPYFRNYGEAINMAFENFHERTGKFIRDSAALKEELTRVGVHFENLEDRWGQPYRMEFGTQNNFFTLTIRSSGPNKVFEPLDAPESDDFPLWTSRIDYATELRVAIGKALDHHLQQWKSFPETDSQFQEMIKQCNVDVSLLKDPWGRIYYPVVRSEHRFNDRINIRSYAEYLQKNKERTEIVPVTQKIQRIILRSGGADGKEGTADDFDVASFSRILSEQSSLQATPQIPNTSIAMQESRGAIGGAITDVTGAVIVGAKVKATFLQSSSQIYETQSDKDGRYLLSNLPPGYYDVRFEMRFFLFNTTTFVPVQSSSITELNATLTVGEVSETVEVSAAAPTIQTNSSERSASRGSTSTGQKPQTSTPRLRQYFPETLVWHPSLETDRAGRAHLNFRFADSITTWKMAVMASTVDGRVGFADQEILAFQPFFIEHDPPRILTQGDEIALPVVLRNYLEKEQTVDLEMKPAGWFSLLGPAEKKSQISARESRREIFPFQAVASVKEGKQQIVATDFQASDAIERVVSVHPDGEEITKTYSQGFKDQALLEATVPQEAIPESVQAEMKIYPNLMAHVIEGVEAILRRPYGCAEQAISSAYPSLIVLRYYTRRGMATDPLAVKARRNVQLGYDRLLAYRTEDGGFSYWGRGKSGIALTAYALQFLNEARDLIPVDNTLLKDTYEWLDHQRNKDGSWLDSWLFWDNSKRHVLNLTALVASILSQVADVPDEVKNSSVSKSTILARTLKNTLEFLRDRTDEIDEPYALASYALAVVNLGDMDQAAHIISRLKSLVHREGDLAYWNLETNTPFYGWGTAGRVETTALAIRALVRYQERLKESLKNEQQGDAIKALSKDDDALVNQALVFLLRNKDRYGIWLSTQATISVLNTLVAVVGKETPKNNTGGLAEILVNGVAKTRVSLPPGDELSGPITVDLSASLASGKNLIELHRPPGQPQATLQVVETHYAPWTSGAPVAHSQTGASSSLRLAVHFDKSNASMGEDVTCQVEAERIAFEGYGMMLAEIGLPPGADVDRASLDRAIASSGWELNQYDILPDRLLVYLWPRAGGTKFEFRFRLRFGLNAQTAPSVLYDYYNPEARTVVAPTRFQVHEP